MPIADAVTHEDPRITRSRQAVIAAVLELVDEIPVAEVTLAAVAQRAGVSRVTVYDRFGSLDELLVAAMQSSVARVRAAAAAIEMPGATAPGEPPQDLVEVFRVIGEHAALYRAMLGDGGSMRFYRRLREGLQEAVRESVRRLPVDPAEWRLSVGAYVDFVAGAGVSLAIGWLEDPGGRDEAVLAREFWMLLTLSPEEFANPD